MSRDVAALIRDWAESPVTENGDRLAAALYEQRMALLDLLEALKALVEDVTHEDHGPHDWSENVCIRNAAAAIAKAESSVGARQP